MYLPGSLSSLRKFGRVALTGQDFMDLCHENDVEVIFSGKASRGFYYCTKEGQHTIVLSTLLKPSERRFVGWHEFAHFLQNFIERKPITAFSGLKNERQDHAKEKLADAFASIALNPEDFRMCRPLEFVAMIMANKEV